MQDLIEQYQDTEFSMLSICVQSHRKVAQRYVDSAMIEDKALFPVGYDGADIFKTMHGNSLPMTFIIDRNRQVRFRHREFKIGMEKQFAREIEILLDEPDESL
ncbi:hypothetical protein KAR48_13430 [bacterium]|nr:hypothetical protein [bacterium]